MDIKTEEITAKLIY